MKKKPWIDYSKMFNNTLINAKFSLKYFYPNVGDHSKNFAKKSGFKNKNLIIPFQTHSNNVVLSNNHMEIKDCDGVFSNKEKNVCSIKVADCMPIFIAHKFEPIFGLVHVGWKGLVNGILNKTSHLLLENKYRLYDFEIVIGPSIQKCCFEVKKDIIDRFNPLFAYQKNDEKFTVNLQEHALHDLVYLGFDNHKINIISECTFCNEAKYHSYRRSGHNAGRMSALIGIK